MRKLASVLCLLALCITSASAQSWNLAHDSGASLLSNSSVKYYTVLTSDGTMPVLSKTGEVTDEVTVWRTGTGVTAQTLVSPTRPSLQGHAAVLNAATSGMVIRPASGVTQTSVWFNASGCDYKLNFEVRWNADGSISVKRLPDDVVSGAIQ